MGVGKGVGRRGRAWKVRGGAGEAKGWGEGNINREKTGEAVTRWK